MTGGKKKPSGKDKKLKRKEGVAKEKALDTLVKTAYGKGNILVDFQPFVKFDRHGLNVSLEYTTADDLTSDLKSYMTTLLKLNMAESYGKKWSTAEREKRQDMVHPDARYIIVREGELKSPVEDLKISASGDVGRCCNHADAICSGTSGGEDIGANGVPASNGAPPAADSQQRAKPLWTGAGNAVVGFVQFRFVVEEGVVVLYVYELQLEERVRGRGLGKYLMQLMELAAKKNGMKGVMLTVQKANPRAMDFYLKKLNYVILPISPSQSDPLESATYEILGKIDAESFASLILDE
eukprot:TRINITY_DN10729_c0_g1_i1.p1 TRINITY_DN10729_c0_g1~~TRINITY_DN10729_c0_g1_i1.p1  ORF type:complete len:295 (+),score=85.62 TRINITY_DN10729_c0_g1_i1:172-1056(+)